MSCDVLCNLCKAATPDGIDATEPGWLRPGGTFFLFIFILILGSTTSRGVFFWLYYLFSQLTDFWVNSQLFQCHRHGLVAMSWYQPRQSLGMSCACSAMFCLQKSIDLGLRPPLGRTSHVASRDEPMAVLRNGIYVIRDDKQKSEKIWYVVAWQAVRRPSGPSTYQFCTSCHRVPPGFFMGFPWAPCILAAVFKCCCWGQSVSKEQSRHREKV